MGLFKDFKDDFSLAIDDLMPDDDDSEVTETQVTATTSAPQELNVEQPVQEEYVAPVEPPVTEEVKYEAEQSFEVEDFNDVSLETENAVEDNSNEFEEDEVDFVLDDEEVAEEFTVEQEPAFVEEENTSINETVEEVQPIEETPVEEPSYPESTWNNDFGTATPVEEPITYSENKTNYYDETPSYNTEGTNMYEENTMSQDYTTPSQPVVDNETSVVTANTVLSGDIQSSGSFDIQGTINGNVTCNGKLTVTGTINGNSSASEFIADVAKIEGEIASTGAVTIGAGTVVIGNISSSSAVIAGAVKGDIDVQGPVVVDASAIIMGNIKSRSVQINNGAVIEGFCSQCYSDIDVQGIFGV